MILSGKSLVWILSACVLSTSARALVADSASGPYHGIVDRNLFNLKAAAPPPGPEANKPQPPKIILTSITTILGKKLATMTIPGRPGQPPVNLMLTEGQGQEGVEVVQIDEVAGTVKVRNQGADQTLDFLNNGAKAPTGPAPAIQPPGAIPLQPPAGVPVPQANAGGMRSLPVRPLRGTPQPEVQPEAQAISSVNSAGGNQSQPPLSPEEQTILIEAQRMHYHETGDPIEKILPPTDLTPELSPQ